MPAGINMRIKTPKMRRSGGMGVIYEVLLGLSVLRSRRDRLPFGEAEQQARATDSSDG